jgi:hypothetical protein
MVSNPLSSLSLLLRVALLFAVSRALRIRAANVV